MKKKLLNEVIEKISPSKAEKIVLENSLDNFEEKLKPYLKKYGAELFIGGSLAKQTIIKRNTDYDIDMFVLFPYNKFKVKSQELSKFLENALRKSKIKYGVLKGSRNYFQVYFKGLMIELIPILKIKNSSQAVNITDISPLHVSYVLTKIKKNKNLANEIKLAKAFCYACDCYGAESYIHGFSGYALEVLVSYYGSFLNFLKAMAKWNGHDKLIVDPANYYKDENIMDELNEAKTHSPIILIDPVQEERNACAALSFKTFERFVKIAKQFLSKPSEKYFFKKNIDVDNLKEEAKRTKSKLIVLEVKSNKDKIDVAGAKTKKFYDYLLYIMRKNGFQVSRAEFDFNEKTLDASLYILYKEPSGSCIILGPPINIHEKYIKAFKKQWDKVFVKNGRLWARSKRKIVTINELLKSISKAQLKEMGIKEIRKK